MGLAVCYRIVEALGGTITAGNNVDRGATIVLELPLSRPDAGGFSGGTGESDFTSPNEKEGAR